MFYEKREMDNDMMRDRDRDRDRDLENVAPNIEQKLDEVKSKLPEMYKEFAKNYVIWQLHPDNVEYQRAFENIKANLKGEESSLIEADESLKKHIISIQKRLLISEHHIHKEKEKNNDLKIAIFPTENKNNASKTLIDDYRETYKEKLLYCIVVFIGVLIMIMFMVNNSSTKIISPPLGKTTLLFVIYILFFAFYVNRYGTSSYTFLVILLPLFIFFVLFMSIFSGRKTGPSAPAPAPVSSHSTHK